MATIPTPQETAHEILTILVDRHCSPGTGMMFQGIWHAYGPTRPTDDFGKGLEYAQANEWITISERYFVTITKKGYAVAKPTPPKSESLVPNIHITNSHGIQIGNHNTMSLVAAALSLSKAIDDSDAAPEKKAEAKSLLKTFLEHPLTSAVVGGAAGLLGG